MLLFTAADPDSSSVVMHMAVLNMTLDPSCCARASNVGDQYGAHAYLRNHVTGSPLFCNSQLVLGLLFQNRTQLIRQFGHNLLCCKL